MLNGERVITDDRSSPMGFTGIDRRSEQRVSPGIALHRASAIEAGSRHGLCVIKNLSSQGAMIQTQFSIDIGEPLVLIMANGIRTAGTVLWKRSGLCGVQFDIAASLSSMLERVGIVNADDSRRMPRIKIVVPAVVTDSHHLMNVTTCDISVAGVRLNCEEGLIEERVKIRLPNHQPISARVRWRANDQVGCIFDRPFTIDELTHWLGTIE